VVERVAWSRSVGGLLVKEALLYAAHGDTEFADPGLPRVQPVGVDADHVDICKPEDRDSLVYGRVRRFVADIRAALTSNSATTSGTRVEAISDGIRLPQERRPLTVPRQLPMEVRHFAGRRTELDQLSEPAHRAMTGSAVVIAAISGPGGIGKTTLAVRWAHSVADRYPDGQLCLNLRGFDPAADPV
jgi:hypothetical protein